jgi:hypothetical protein
MVNFGVKVVPSGGEVEKQTVEVVCGGAYDSVKQMAKFWQESGFYIISVLKDLVAPIMQTGVFYQRDLLLGQSNAGILEQLDLPKQLKTETYAGSLIARTAGSQLNGCEHCFFASGCIGNALRQNNIVRVPAVPLAA